MPWMLCEATRDQSQVFPLEDDDLRKIKRTIAELSPPPTKDLVERKKSRFTD